MSKKLAGGRVSRDGRSGAVYANHPIRIAARITSDPLLKVGYITLIPHVNVYQTKEVELEDISLLFDLDRGGNILGIEIIY
jgi:uncharacterized protein YuzE